MRTLTEETFHEEYLIYRTLNGYKAFASFLALRESPEHPPFPVFLKETDEKRALIYDALCGAWNPHMASTYEVLQVKSDDALPDRFYAVTEFVCAPDSFEEESLSLTRFIQKNGPLKEKAALAVGCQLCEGLREFHRRGFVHRDLKPDNLMVFACNGGIPQVKIVDLGGAKWDDPKRHTDTTVTGTMGYQSPESLALRTTRQADVYSIGCIISFLLTGCDPGLARYRGNHYIAAMIEKAANEDPSCRYASVTELQKELEHLLGKRLIDRIPFLRALPGFRSDTLWKMLLACFAYVFLLPACIFCHQNFLPSSSFLDVFLPYVIIPQIILFNMGNLLRFFPESLRRNNRLFFKVKAAIILVAFFEPAFIQDVIKNFK